MFGRGPSIGISDRAPVWPEEGYIVTPVREADPGRGIRLVPSEPVLMLTVDLPLPTRRQRLGALPFALEDRLAEPLERLHVALGAEVSPGRYLAAAVRHEQMRAWVEDLEAEGRPRFALVPDALALPVPIEGGWSVALENGRARVRTADAAGFAVPEALLPAAWAAAGQPLTASYGETLPSGMATIAVEALEPYALRVGAVPLDLRQGLYAARSRPGAVAVRRLALAVVLGAAAHTAIAGADALALHRIATDRHARALAAVQQISPGVTADSDLVAAFDRLAPAGGGVKRSDFLPLLLRTAQALTPFTAGISINNLGYVANDRAISMDVEASDLATLQRVQAALNSAGLNPVGGAATAENGRAEGRIVVRNASPGGAS